MAFVSSFSLVAKAAACSAGNAAREEVSGCTISGSLGLIDIVSLGVNILNKIVYFYLKIISKNWLVINLLIKYIP
jgi:hypothetical protein